MKKEIKLASFKKLWKTKKALENVNPEVVEVVKEYWHKTHKPQGSVTWKDIADRVFSEYCRLYYADDEWYVNCITSWVRMFWTEAQCWHFISRWVLKYRYDINNCFPQSYTDNCILSWNYKVYTIKMIQMFGQEKVEQMINDKELVSLSQSWYEEHIVERYKFIIDKKEKIKKHQKSVYI